MLSSELEDYGSRRSLLYWLKSYMSDGPQKVNVGEYLSDELKIKYDMPKGSVLGPLLFLVYNNHTAVGFQNHNTVISFTCR